MASERELSEARELVDLNVEEVSLVDRAAIQRTFLVTKRSEKAMSTTTEETNPETQPQTEETVANEPTPTPEPDAPSEAAAEAAAEAAPTEPEEGGEEPAEEGSQKGSIEPPANIGEALAVFEGMLSGFDGANLVAGQMVLDQLRTTVEQTPAAPPASEPAGVAKSDTQRAALVGIIENAQRMLKEFDGEEPKNDEPAEPAKLSPAEAIDAIAKSTADKVLKQIEPRLKQAEQTVEKAAQTIPVPRSSHPEPTEPVTKADEDRSTEELFGSILG